MFTYIIEKIVFFSSFVDDNYLKFRYIKSYNIDSNMVGGVLKLNNECIGRRL